MKLSARLAHCIAETGVTPDGPLLEPLRKASRAM